MIHRNKIGDGSLLLGSLAGLVIDYLRWTQLAPMITVWLFGLGMLLAMLFVSNQEAAWGLVESTARRIADLPWLGDRFVSKMESLAGEEGTISLGGKELNAFALKAWGIASLAFMLLAWLINWAFGPFRPWPLKRKLGVAGLCCLALLGAFFLSYFANREMFNGPAWRWMLSLSGMGLVLFIISAWCLSIAHLLGVLRRAVVASTRGEPSASGWP